MPGDDVAAVRESAAAVRDAVGAARQEAAVHGRRAGDTHRVEPRRHARLVAPRRRHARRRPHAARRPQRALRERTGDAPRRQRRRGDPMGRRRRRRPQRVRLAALDPSGDARPVLAVFNATPDAAPQLPHRRSLAGRWTEVLNTDDPSTAAAASATTSGCRHGAGRRPRLHHSLVVSVPPLGAAFFVPGRSRWRVNRDRWQRRRLGATPIDGGTRFEVWAPDASSRRGRGRASGRGSARRRADRRPNQTMARPSADATWSRVVDDVGAGDRYRFRIDGGELLADPASRLQPRRGPRPVGGRRRRRRSSGPTVTGPASHSRDTVLYELHVGTFTPGRHVRRRDRRTAIASPTSASRRSS